MTAHEVIMWSFAVIAFVLAAAVVSVAVATAVVLPKIAAAERKKLKESQKS
ncbi:MAG: hypothetical protein ACRYGK_03770 [Janthinobacterium lividum]